jgi:hypothetical protein
MKVFKQRKLKPRYFIMMFLVFLGALYANYVLYFAQSGLCLGTQAECPDLPSYQVTEIIAYLTIGLFLLLVWYGVMFHYKKKI